MERELGLARTSYANLVMKTNQMSKLLMEHTNALKAMQDTIRFQGSFMGDMNNDWERSAKEVSEHMKEACGVHKAHRLAIEATNERVTRRRREVDTLDNLVSARVCQDHSTRLSILSVLDQDKVPKSGRMPNSL